MVLLKMKSILLVKRLANEFMFIFFCQANNLIPEDAFSSSGSNLSLRTFI